ncbi:MAG: DinB family protein [Chloroflexota bacterium]
MTDPAPLTPAHLAALLDASRRAVVAEMAALGSHAAERLIEGEWCANEVVGHLIEAEIRGFAGRIKIMVTEERPKLQTWVQPAVAAARHDDERNPDDLVAELNRLRDESLALVRSLGPAAFARVGLHPQVGEVTVAEIAHEWVHHDREHLVQLLEQTRRLVWPAMGNARLFSDPDA